MTEQTSDSPPLAPLDGAHAAKLLERLGYHGITTDEEADVLFALAARLPELLRDSERYQALRRWTDDDTNVHTQPDDAKGFVLAGDYALNAAELDRHADRLRAHYASPEPEKPT